MPRPSAAAVAGSSRPTSEAKKGHEESASGELGLVGYVTDWLKKLLTDPIALFTLVLAVFTVKLWTATKNLAVSAERTSKVQLRAYIAATEAHIMPLTVNQLITLQVDLKNVGQTPAHALRTQSSVIVTKFPIDPGYQPPDEEWTGSQGTIGTGAEFSVPIHLGKLLDAADYKAIKSGSMAIYLNAKVQYRDVFGDLHTTNCRFFHTGSQDSVMTVDSSGNDAD